MLVELISSGTSTDIIDKDAQGAKIVSQVMNLLKKSKHPLVRKRCIQLIPSMYKFIKGYFDQDRSRFDEAMNAIFAFIEDKSNKNN